MAIALFGVGSCVPSAGCSLVLIYPEGVVEDTPELCGNALDDDFDGVRDCVQRSCRAAGFCAEHSADECGDGLDDDGDGLPDAADPGCFWLHPPHWTRCTSIPGVNIDPDEPIDRHGWLGEAQFTMGAGDRSDRVVVVGSSEHPRLVFPQPWTGALHTLRFGVDIWVEDTLRGSAVQLALVPAETVDPTLGWNQREEVFLLSVGVSAGLSTEGVLHANETLLRTGSGDGAWRRVELRFEPTARELVATMFIPDDPAAGSVELRAPIRDLGADPILHLLLIVGPAQVDRLFATSEWSHPCGTLLPRYDDPVRTVMGVARTPAGDCALVRSLDDQTFGQRGSDGAYFATTAGPLDVGPGRRIERAALAWNGTEVAGVVAVVADTAPDIRPGVLALRAVRADPACETWELGPEEQPPVPIAIDAIALEDVSGDAIAIAGSVESSESTRIVQLRREAGVWIRTRTSAFEPAPASAVTALRALGGELAAVSTDDGETLLHVRTSADVWLPATPWVAPSRLPGTVDATSIGPGVLRIEPSGILYHYESERRFNGTTLARALLDAGEDG